jgi:hypothetical protein
MSSEMNPAAEDVIACVLAGDDEVTDENVVMADRIAAALRKSGFTFDARGITYTIALLDEPEVDNDPTLLVFRDDDEEPLVSIHLTEGTR